VVLTKVNTSSSITVNSLAKAGVHAGLLPPSDSALKAGAAKPNAPMRPSAAVEAVMVAVMTELRRVWTANISVPACADMALSQSCRNWSWARQAGWRAKNAM
jgi:hypothetical protein